MSAHLREQVEWCIEQQDWSKAQAALALLWRRERTTAMAGYVTRRVEALRGSISMSPCRLAILRSFTLEPLVPLARAAAFAGGIDLTVHLGDFNAYAQEILNPGGALYAFAPDVVILAVQTRDAAMELWGERGSDSASATGAADYARAADAMVFSFRQWVAAFRSRSAAHLVLHGLEEPLLPSRGILDAQVADGQAASIRRANEELRQLAREHKGVYFLDYDALVARHGRGAWFDARKWLMMRMPIAAGAMVHLAEEWLRFLHPLCGRTCKVLVTDLDNTLWGGVVGEDGVGGIRVGTDHPGAPYHALQRAMLDLRERGVLLAVCSKNNPAEALEALGSHPGMLLRPQHFAAVRVNWDDKARNLREIAVELNVGVDALAFLDDNPAERERVRAELPEVTVIELPSDPAGYAAALRSAPVFERLALADEDRQRPRYYSEQRRRAESEISAPSLQEFYRSLDQRLEVAPVAAATLARAAQLTQKTNQFNLTTRRYTEQQVAQIGDSADWGDLMRVTDKFGDNGIVGLGILHFHGPACEIDTFLLSCRVIGRTVETAFLAYLLRQARARGAERMEGWFRPTRKNAPAREFYSRHGFRRHEPQPGEEPSEAASLWSFDLAQGEVAVPEWITLVAVAPAEAASAGTNVAAPAPKE